MLYKTLLGVMCVMGLTACQSTTLNLPKNHQENGKQLLNHALKRALYQQQTWVSEHQLYLKNNPQATPVDDLTICQNTHDKRFVKQMADDKLVKFSEVAELSDEKQAVYQQIKQDYLDCYEKYEENINGEVKEIIKTDYLVDSVDDNANKETWQHQVDNLNNVMKVMGFSTAQIDSINQFLLKSGKLTVTGNYQPLAGEMSLMFDAGFENKNLKYHYRLPVVLNIKQQSMYVKPDIFMPTIALYLDNQMGLSWQDKWYKIHANIDNLPQDKQFKAWIYALKQSFDELPNSQFTTIDSRLLLPNVAHASQKIAKNGIVVKWQQTAKEQDNLYQDMLENYIQVMDNDFLTSENEQYRTAWQASKEKLQAKLENRLAVEPDENNRLTGQIVYFVLENGELKQIFTQHKATTRSQNYQFNSFITFNPDESLLNFANQPTHIANLRKTIVDTDEGNVVEAKTEIERLLKLDNSRRLFGSEPEWLKYLGKMVKVEAVEDDD